MKSRKKMMVFIICYIAYTAIYIARLNLSMASVTLEQMEAFNKAQYGIIGGVFAVIYALGRLFNGVLNDRLAPSFMISVGLGLAAVSNLVLGFLPPYGGFLVLWGLNAYAQSMLWGSILEAMNRIYEGEKAKKMATYLVTTVATGNVIGVLLSTWLIETFGVRYAFIVPGGICLLSCIATLVFCRDLPEKELATQAPEGKRKSAFLSLFRIKEVRQMMLPTFFQGVIKDNINYWMTLYFVATYEVDLGGTIGFLVLVPTVGFVGRLSYMWLYRLLGHRAQSVSTLAFGLCVVCAALICFKVPMAVSAVCLGLLYAATSIINTTAQSLFPMRHAATGHTASISGIMDLASYAGYAAGSAIFGFVIEKTGNYAIMFGTFAVLSLVSILLLHPLRVSEKKTV